jgi:hypothetical protein
MLDFLFFVELPLEDSWPVERMGLYLSDEQRQELDAMRALACMQDRESFLELKQLVKKFWIRVLTDPTASVRSNPLLWWLAVLNLTDCEEVEVDDCLRRESRDWETFEEALSSVEYYGRLALLDHGLCQWRKEATKEALDRKQWKQAHDALAQAGRMKRTSENNSSIDRVIGLLPARVMEGGRSEMQQIWMRFLTVEGEGVMTTVLTLQARRVAAKERCARLRMKYEIAAKRDGGRGV